jgi:Tripartite tricarboxylate transporter TctB family
MSSPESPGVGGLLNHDLFAGLAAIALGTLTYFTSPGWDDDAWVFPNAIATGLIVVGALLLGSAAMHRRRENVLGTRLEVWDAAWFAGSLLVYLYFVEAIGYLYATWAFIVVESLVLTTSRRWRNVAIAIALAGLGAGFITYLFSEVFNVPLPDGALL